ncbi:septum site-determining protein MinC [Bacillus sp. HMF5848]|uniref:septum site-determining protein MinC n=1 Tax=Bacillus sp. HMF5848 TaxID=2495421 RepID=UPI000F7B965C|nr:septum site-determining protein MinC [Bacillus sp. HMF5848]RSK28012.1 septum site-determining protein MinC [Bacillus sp. HMF5848]
MEKQKLPYVTIKGTKKGITLHLDDTCSFRELIEELDEKLSTTTQGLVQNHQLTQVKVHVGNRFLTDGQAEEIKAIIRGKKQLVVDVIESHVVSKAEALQWKLEGDTTTLCKIVRSGQVVEVEGDLLLIGDVNPGGKVVAKGNIFIIGALKGMAHAGCNGNKEAVIAASLMKPTHLKIEELISRSPDTMNEEESHMECAYVNGDNQIVVDRIQLLPHVRPNLSKAIGKE